MYRLCESERHSRCTKRSRPSSAPLDAARIAAKGSLTIWVSKASIRTASVTSSCAASQAR
eukprot:6260634-Prymnesium_polylepis.2